MRLDVANLLVRRAEIAAGARTCTGCGEVKPLAAFYGKTEKPFLMAECRECFKERVAFSRLRRALAQAE